MGDVSIFWYYIIIKVGNTTTMVYIMSILYPNFWYITITYSRLQIGWEPCQCPSAPHFRTDQIGGSNEYPIWQEYLCANENYVNLIEEKWERQFFFWIILAHAKLPCHLCVVNAAIEFLKSWILVQVKHILSPINFNYTKLSFLTVRKFFDWNYINLKGLW